MSTDIRKTAQIFQFAAIRPKLGKKTGSSREPVSTLPRNEPATETGRNFRLRQQRRDEWLRADAVREYWKAARKMDSAIHRVQNHELPEGEMHQPLVPRSWQPIMAKYRAAIMAQLLTPAPTAREIEWKRAAFKAGDHGYTDVKPEMIERAIAADVEFLKAHPTRRSGKQGMDPQKLEERREWKTAFRARVTAFADKNGISKSELAWLGRLKHQELAAFADRHRLSYDWLLTGEGPAPN